VFLAALLLATVPGAALAHGALGGAGALITGFVHPLTGIDHLFAAIGVGALAQRLGGRLRLVLPGAFWTGVFGGLLAPIPSLAGLVFEVLLASTLIATSLLMLAGRALHTSVLTVAAFSFAFLHGHAHRIEHVAMDSPAALIAGIAAATAAVLVSGSLLMRVSFVRELAPRHAAIAFASTGLVLLATTAGGIA